MSTVRTTIYLEATDRQLLLRLKTRYGFATLSDALRFAIRQVESLQEETALLKEQVESTRQTLEREREELLNTRRELDATMQEIQGLNREIQTLAVAAADRRSGAPEATPGLQEDERRVTIRAKAQQVFTAAREHYWQCVRIIERLQAQSAQLVVQTRAIRNTLKQERK